LFYGEAAVPSSLRAIIRIHSEGNAVTHYSSTLLIVSSIRVAIIDDLPERCFTIININFPLAAHMHLHAHLDRERHDLMESVATVEGRSYDA
jgi:hypothetical protein